MTGNVLIPGPLTAWESSYDPTIHFHAEFCMPKERERKKLIYALLALYVLIVFLILISA